MLPKVQQCHRDVDLLGIIMFKLRPVGEGFLGLDVSSLLTLIHSSSGAVAAALFLLFPRTLFFPWGILLRLALCKLLSRELSHLSHSFTY